MIKIKETIHIIELNQLPSSSIVDFAADMILKWWWRINDIALLKTIVEIESSHHTFVLVFWYMLQAKKPVPVKKRVLRFKRKEAKMHVVNKFITPCPFFSFLKRYIQLISLIFWNKYVCVLQLNKNIEWRIIWKVLLHPSFHPEKEEWSHVCWPWYSEI